MSSFSFTQADGVGQGGLGADSRSRGTTRRSDFSLYLAGKMKAVSFKENENK